MKDKDLLIEELLTRGVEKIYPGAEELRERLRSDNPLKIYLGIDPTGPTLHLGHIIPIMKLSQFQALGHKVILLIGDITAQIGDPDKTSVRKQLTKEEVLTNCSLYLSQAEKFLSFVGENKAELRYNSEWLEKIKLEELLKIASNISIPQILKRDMFQERLAQGHELYLHEFLYPLLQGYDSVALGVDVEVGGNDQTFNMLVGRDLSKKMIAKDKFVIAMKLLVDPTGKKMGKTEGNMLTVSDNARDMVGKVMSWTDGMIVLGFELCTMMPAREVLEIEQLLKSGVNPRDLKMQLAREIVKLYYDPETAKAEEENFVRTVSNKEIPIDAPEIIVPAGTLLRNILVDEGFVRSGTEYRQKIIEGAIDLDGERVTDSFLVINHGGTVRIGKHKYLKIIVK